MLLTDRIDEVSPQFGVVILFTLSYNMGVAGGSIALLRCILQLICSGRDSQCPGVLYMWRYVKSRERIGDAIVDCAAMRDGDG